MINKKILRELIVSSYSKDDLMTLATDIAENAEFVYTDDGTLEKRARELIDWCDRHSKLQMLIEEIKTNRPDRYKDYKNKFEDNKDSPLTEVQSESEKIEDVFGALRSVEIKKETMSSEVKRPRKIKHPLVGSQTSVHNWFKKLRTDQQVFIVSAALFSGLQKDELMHLYSNALRVLGISTTPSDDEGG